MQACRNRHAVKIDELLDPISDLADMVPFGPERQGLVVKSLTQAARIYAEFLRLSKENKRLASTLESVRSYAESRRCDCDRVWSERFAQSGCLRLCEREVLLSYLCTRDEKGGSDERSGA